MYGWNPELTPSVVAIEFVVICSILLGANERWSEVPFEEGGMNVFDVTVEGGGMPDPVAGMNVPWLAEGSKGFEGVRSNP